MELQGKTAIVTGGAVRIGRALSIALACEGVNICIHCGSSVAAAEKTAAEIESYGVRATVVQADLSHGPEAARSIFEHATAKFGAVDFLINSAAIFEPGTLAETTDEAYDRHFAINLKAPFFLCREFAARLSSNTRRCCRFGNIGISNCQSSPTMFAISGKWTAPRRAGSLTKR